MIDDDVSRCSLALIDPFVYQWTAKIYKVLQLHQSGRWGERADTDFLRTEI